MNVRHQEMRPKPESGDCFSVIPIIIYITLLVSFTMLLPGLDFICQLQVLWEDIEKGPALQSLLQTRFDMDPHPSLSLKASPKPWQLVSSSFLPGKAAVHGSTKALPPPTMPRGVKCRSPPWSPAPPSPTLSFSFPDSTANHWHCLPAFQKGHLSLSMWEGEGGRVPLSVKQKLRLLSLFRPTQTVVSGTANEKTKVIN